MTEKQRRFADEYLIDANATQAYIRAGYSKKGAGQSAEKLLKKTEIRKYIDERLAQMDSERVANAEEVMKYLTSVLRGETTAEVVVVEGQGDGFSEARKITKAPDEKERLKAAELLGKRFGIFKENVTLDIEPITIVDDLKE